MKNLSLLALLFLVFLTGDANAQGFLRQSTASQTVEIGPYLAPADGTALNGLTVANTDIKISKAGGNQASKNSGSCSITNHANGMYVCTFDATDTNTIGLFQVSSCISTAVCVRNNFYVLPAVNYDILLVTAPGAANGLLQAGNNVATTFTGTAASGATPAVAGLTLLGGAASTTGGGVSSPGLLVTGGAGAASTNGAGNGVSVNGGGTTTVAGGNGLVILGTGTGAGASIGSGTGASAVGLSIISLAASGNGNGVRIDGAGTGHGLFVNSGGGATGDAASFVSNSTNGVGFRVFGSGNQAGFRAQGGATGDAISALGGATSGNGATIAAQTSGIGLQVTGVGTTQAGFAATGGSTSSSGALFSGGGTGSGIRAVGGATGEGARYVGGATSGAGVAYVGTAGNSAAATYAGQGSAAGVSYTGGATGVGMQLTGGATSGNALGSTITAPLGAVPEFGIRESGTMQAGSTSTTAVLRAATSFTADDRVKGSVIEIFAGTGAGESLPILSYVNSTDTATMDGTWPTMPDNTSQYFVWSTAPASASSAPSASTVASAVWDLDATAHQTQGTFGQVVGDSTSTANSIWGLANTNLNATVSSRATQTSVDTAATNVATLLEAEVILGAELTADSGTTTTIVDAALTQATNNWFNGGTKIHFTSGTLLGQSACATTFTASSDTLAFSPAVTTAVTTHTYYLLSDASCAFAENNSGAIRFTAAALAQAPSGTGASAVSIADEVQTRTIAGVTTVTNLTNAPTIGDLTTAMKTSVQTAAAAAINADTGDTFTAIPTIAAVTTVTNLTNAPTAGDLTSTMKTSVQTVSAAALNAEDGANFTAIPAGVIDDAVLAAIPSAATIAISVGDKEGLLTGTCDSGSTTICVDDARTEAAASQLQDRMICYPTSAGGDGWCGLITTFTPASDTITTTKVAPSTRSGKPYAIYPTTAQ